MHVDPLYTAAQRTNQSGGRGWHFPANDERESSKPGLFLAVVAVVLIGLAFIGAIDGMIR